MEFGYSIAMFYICIFYKEKHMNPTISVIVPIYNVEPYIQKCVDSLRNQTFTDLRLFW